MNWIDEDSGEAGIILSDGVYSIECFCSESSLSEGDLFSGILYGFNIKDVVKSFNEEYTIDKKDDNYHIRGKLVDLENEVLQIGEFKIDLSDGNIPKDIRQNEYIEADISRIDLY